MAVFVLLFLSYNPSMADIPTDVRIGVPDIPPFGYERTKGEQIDWWQELAKRAGFRPIIRILPLTRLRRALEHGVIDAAIYGPGPAPVRDVVDLGVHQSVNFSFYIPSHPARDLNVLKGAVVGAVRGASGVEELSARYGFDVFFVSSYAMGLSMLNGNRLDAIYGIENIVNFNYARMREELSGFTLPEPIPAKSIKNKVRVSQSFAERYPEAVETMEEIAKELAQEGFVDQTIMRHEK